MYAIVVVGADIETGHGDAEPSAVLVPCSCRARAALVSVGGENITAMTWEPNIDRYFGQATGCDPLLAQMMALPAACWRVSLFIDGHEFTGVIITAYGYMQLLDKQMIKYDKEMGSAAGFIRHEEGWTDPTRAPEPDHLDPGEPEFIHLAETTIRRGTETEKIGLWRGRTAAITSWTLRSPDWN